MTVVWVSSGDGELCFIGRKWRRILERAESLEVQFGSVRFGSVRFGLVRFGANWCGFVRCGAMRCGVVRPHGLLMFVSSTIRMACGTRFVDIFFSCALSAYMQLKYFGYNNKGGLIYCTEPDLFSPRNALG